MNTQDIIFRLAVLAPTRKNKRKRKKLHKMLCSMERDMK